MASKCKFCGSSSYGSCSRSPHGKHQHIGGDERHCVFCGYTVNSSPCPKSPYFKHQTEYGGNKGSDDKRCAFCGSSSYGSCSKSPHGKHQHGHGANKCIYCGSTSSSGSCSKSPHGKHEK